MKKQPKFIDSFWVFIVATAVSGPLALPLLWRNPHYSVKTKTLVTVAVLAFTALLLYLTKVVLVEFLNP